MRALLDVSALLALMDPVHTAHGRMQSWMLDDGAAGWASCAVTQLGFVRVTSQAAYPNSRQPSVALSLLSQAASQTDHEWWDADLPLTDARFDGARLLGHRQVTDAYLLALAIHHGGRFVTLDRRVTPGLVEGATAEQLVVI